MSEASVCISEAKQKLLDLYNQVKKGTDCTLGLSLPYSQDIYYRRGKVLGKTAHGEWAYSVLLKEQEAVSYYWIVPRFHNSLHVVSVS